MHNATTKNIADSSWERVKYVLELVIDVPADQRRESARIICGGDEKLLAEVDSMLDSFDESDDFLESPAFSSDHLFDHNPFEGRKFGNYTIEREVGRGGMGAVYLAERTDGEFDQKVALKIVRQSIAESHVIDRFRRERQILASLNHPNIARLLDGGVSKNGEPFLVMEFVEGVSITDYAANANVTLRDKLLLFLKVCSALAFAHRSLIVHRDIKPGNIMVTADGEPKLLDFGLAKLAVVSQKPNLDETKTEFRALTPAYASPEQLRGEQITTASDIYSLGVVLYELLTEGRPYNLEGKSLDEIINAITTQEPTAPSANAAAGVAASSLRGDLDNVVLMALRREPERRYLTVEAFADDIERYLDSRPVSARPNTFRYRSGKYIRRHRFGVAAAALILIAVIAGLAGSLWQAREARREKQKAENVSKFLEDTLKYSNPIISKLKKAGRDVTVNEVLDEASRRLKNGEFDNDLELKSDLESMISRTYFGQGRYIEAREHMAEHVRLVRTLYGENDPKTLFAGGIWAGLLFAKGDLTEAEAEFRHYLPQIRIEYERGNMPAEALVEVLDNFGYMRRTQGDSHEAEMAFREGLEIFPKLSEDSKRMVETTKSTLASTIADQGRFEEALATAQEAVDYYRSRNDSENPSYGFALNILGGFQTEKGDYDAALANLVEADRIFKAYLSPTGLWNGDNARNQAIVFYDRGEYEKAVDKANIAARNYEENFGKHYDHYPTVLIAKGLSLVRLGREKEGEDLIREAVDMRTSTLPPGHFWVAAANGALGECLMLEKRYTEAEPLLKSSFDSLKASQEPSSPRLKLARDRLDQLYRETGRAELTQAVLP